MRAPRRWPAIEPAPEDLRVVLAGGERHTLITEGLHEGEWANSHGVPYHWELLRGVDVVEVLEQ